MLDEFIDRPRIGYFSMEVAVRADISTYSGGLGILAGDTIRTAADLELPMVAVSLVSHLGYFRQELSAEGRQAAQPDAWQVSRWMSRVGAKVVVPIEGREIWVGAWLYVVEGHQGGREPVLFLDTQLAENEDADQHITDQLYGGDATYRFKQEIVLGIGGARMLHALGFRIRKYHMNEGHAALLALELLRRHSPIDADRRLGEPIYDIAAVRGLCNFTTHTPVGAGHDDFSYDLVERVLGPFLDGDMLRHLGGDNSLDMTRLAMNLSGYINGVAKLHAETSRRLFPGYAVRAVTNGVHAYTWTAPTFAEIYDRHLPGWCHEPEILVRARCCIPDDEIWQAHVAAKQRLLKLVYQNSAMNFDPELPIIGFARRMTAYKRPELLFHDIARLKGIASRWPFQIVMAGKAHPQDSDGQQRIEHIHAAMRALAPDIRCAFLSNYEMSMAQILIPGVDLWLNTPQRPMEASGTSGMKAALNGVPSLSALDGWWVEGCVEGITGWSIGDHGDGSAETDSRSLYDKLEQQIMPLFHSDRAGWIAVMKSAIMQNGSLFNSHRMMRRYASEAYL